MADIPNRLPAPEKRKDKISKNSLRYLYKLQKTEERSQKRERVNTEITNEKRQSEKRVRVSTGNAAVKQLKLG